MGNDERPRRQLNIKQVLGIVPVSESTLIRMIRRGEFPCSHSISPGRCAWYEDEVIAWQRNRPVNDKIVRRARLRAQADNR
ncbi:helix-turn-helix transcriptional regulator [Bradyrhizobium sp.]|uniref:helix-turn-helix transcriptional regulator n=1 Tax=Bradyrhizobium sp. TaxID=376 RepID=UPI00345D449A